MKAEIYQDEGYKLMSAPLQLGLVTRSVGAERALGQPGGLPDISRGLSASDTPGTPPENEPHPGGVPEPTGQSQPVPSPLAIARFWHPSRVQRIPAFQSGGIASLCSAQPPANFCEPSGFVPPYYIQILNQETFC